MIKPVVIFFLILIAYGLLQLRTSGPEETSPAQAGRVLESLIDSNNAPPPFVHEDTAFFTYDKPNEIVPYYEGTQSNGTMHKVGLCSDVDSDFPQIAGLSSQMIVATENANRDTFLVNSGYTPQLSIRYWLVDITDATDNGQGQIEVTAECRAGSDACGACIDGVIKEQWLLSNGQLTLSSRNFVDGFRVLGHYSLDGN